MKRLLLCYMVVILSLPFDVSRGTINESDRPHILTRSIVERFSADPKVVDDALKFAEIYAYPDFPRAIDITAVIGIESSWKISAVSPFQYDAAVGLTQIRPKVWKDMIADPRELYSVNRQIMYSSKILRDYYLKLGSKSAALIAYNAGITNFKKKIFDTKYLVKYNKEMKILEAKYGNLSRG